MTDWLKIILAVEPRANRKIAQGLADAMPAIVETWGVRTPLDQAHFISQTGHESDGFQTTVEYASGDAYDTRTDLGFTKAKDGDGRKFKGFGLIQTTGPDNQRKAASALGILAEWKKNPRILSEMPWAALSAAFYWKSRGLSAIANRDDVETLTRRINGGLNGFADRKTRLARAKLALGIDVEAGALRPAPLRRKKIASLQSALKAGGYPIGTVDGLVGGKTIGAISAFQHDNALAVNGLFDSDTVEAIEAGVAPAPVAAARATGKPTGSRILASARSLKVGAVGLMAPAAAKLADDPLSALEGVGGYWSRAKALVEPFGDLSGLIADHWPLALIAVAIGVFFLAQRIAAARVEDHRKGVTL